MGDGTGQATGTVLRVAARQRDEVGQALLRTAVAATLDGIDPGTALREAVSRLESALR